MLGFQKVIATASMNKICRICLEEGVLSSMFAKDYNIALGDMIDYCSNIKISKNDGLPEQICSNCIYKLGIAYQFKQTTQRSDMRLRQYLGLPMRTKFMDVSVMTDPIETRYPTIVTKWMTKQAKGPHDVRRLPLPRTTATPPTLCPNGIEIKFTKLTHGYEKPDVIKRSNYKKKSESEKLKRGPKPKPKKIHSCVQCSKEFRCEAQLEMHVRTHTGDKPFVCMYCPRSFTQKHNLAIHLRLHTGEKPFQCEVCSKRFSAQGNLNAHLKIHTGQKDHVCTVCFKSFITTSELSRHMHKHTKVKNFKCDLCGAPYTHNRDLKLHMKKHHSSASEQKSLNEAFNNSNNIDIIGLDDVNTSIPKVGSHFIIQSDNSKHPSKVDTHFMHHSGDIKHQNKVDTNFMHHSGDTKHQSGVGDNFVLQSNDNKHQSKVSAHFMHQSDDSRHQNKVGANFMHHSDDDKHHIKVDTNFMHHSDDSKHQSRVDGSFVLKPDENKNRSKVGAQFMHQSDDSKHQNKVVPHFTLQTHDGKQNYLHKPENHSLYDQKVKGFHQYNEKTVIESHNCTICGEVFNCVVALAQHCLNHHKGYTPLQTSKTYI